MMKTEYTASYTSVLNVMRQRLTEPAPGHVQVLTGPRQVGKTTLLLELAKHWGKRALYAAADTPEASLPGWWEQQWQRAEQLAQSRGAVLLIDEIQYLAHWSRLLKAGIDRVRRERIALHVVVSGSSSLHIGKGARETMAGRYERLQLLHWSAAEIAERFGVTASKAVEQTVQYGSYPGAVSLLSDLTRWREYVRQSIMEPAVGRDLMMLETIRKPALLRQVFALCTGHPAEIISLQKLCGQLTDKGSLETVAHYLHVLEEAYLVAAVPKYSEKALRQRAAPPKLIVLNNAFLGATSNRLPPQPDAEPERWGRWVENACLAHAWNAGQQVCYWRAEPYEVDMVLDGSWGRWAIEVKSGPYALNDLDGLLEFCRRNRQFSPAVLCAPGDESVARGAGMRALSWRAYLLSGLTGLA
jgi:uncharacterized protein